MKKKLIELSIVLSCLGISILTFIIFRTQESKELMGHLDIWSQIKIYSKPVLAFTLALVIISAPIRAIILFLRQKRTNKAKND